MTKIFVDAQYFVALVTPKDQWRERAMQARVGIVGRKFVTTEAVLIEVLNFLCNHGPALRREVSLFVRDILQDVDFDVVSQNDTTLLNGLDLYESRLDKGYSLTDCISMNVCKELGISEVLSGDKHFQQEGFEILL